MLAQKRDSWVRNDWEYAYQGVVKSGPYVAGDDSHAGTAHTFPDETVTVPERGAGRLSCGDGLLSFQRPLNSLELFFKCVDQPMQAFH
jgi:hypothetical protein